MDTPLEALRKKLYYTDDAVEVILDYLVSTTAYLGCTGPAYEPAFRDHNVGGDNIISNFEIVFYAGHGSPCRFRVYPQYNSTTASSSMNISEVNPVNKLKWLAFLSCYTLSCSEDIIALFIFRADPSTYHLTRNTIIHGVVGFSSDFIDHQTNGLGEVVWSMKDFAEYFTNYLDRYDGAFIPAWIKAVKEAAEKTNMPLTTKYAYSYVMVEVAVYLDKHSPPMYELVTFDYSEEKIPLSDNDEFYPTPGSTISITNYIKKEYNAYRVVLISYYGEVIFERKTFS